MAEPPRASFLGIPSELRLHIYDQVLMSPFEIHFYGTARGASRRRMKGPPIVALKMVCRKIHNELQNIPQPPISEAMCVFDDCSRVDMEAWLDVIGTEDLAKMRRFTICNWGECIPLMRERERVPGSTQCKNAKNHESCESHRRDTLCKRSVKVDLVHIHDIILAYRLKNSLQKPLGKLRLPPMIREDIVLRTGSIARFDDCSSEDQKFECVDQAYGLHAPDVFGNLLTEYGGYVGTSRKSLLDIFDLATGVGSDATRKAEATRRQNPLADIMWLRDFCGEISVL